MMKFSSFLTFVFGVLVMLAIGYIFVEKSMNPNENNKFDRTVLPESNLPALTIGSQEQFLAQLDRLYEAGGVQAVSSYIEKEFVPGRTLVIPSTYMTEPAQQMVLLDREIRRSNREGAVMIEIPPVLNRVNASIHPGDDTVLRTWSRNTIQQPFNLTVWWVPQRVSK